jgi:hypothetical protein
MRVSTSLGRPVRGFKTLKTAYATNKGFEVTRALRKGQAAMFSLTRDLADLMRPGIMVEIDPAEAERQMLPYRLSQASEFPEDRTKRS